MFHGAQQSNSRLKELAQHDRDRPGSEGPDGSARTARIPALGSTWPRSLRFAAGASLLHLGGRLFTPSRRHAVACISARIALSGSLRRNTCIFSRAMPPWASKTLPLPVLVARLSLIVQIQAELHVVRVRQVIPQAIPKATSSGPVKPSAPTAPWATALPRAPPPGRREEVAGQGRAGQGRGGGGRGEET